MGDIFIKFLNMSITAGWLILAVLCIRFLFWKMPKWITCLLWGVVAIRLIFPFDIESAFSLQPSAEPISSSAMIEGELVPYVPSVDSNLGIVEDAVNPLLAETFAYQESESVTPLQIATGIAGNIWLCGMMALLIFALVSMVRLRLCVREAVLYKENIYICDAVKFPFILGIVKPRIYLSSALVENELDYIVAHEMAHLRRKDYLWKPFGYLLLCVYWFNPLCWIAYIMLCKDIEIACDEKVIKDMSFGYKQEYSRVLLSCATQKRLVLACPLAFGEVGVKERVKSVLNYKKPTFWITIPAIIICIIVAVCFLTNPEKEYQITEENSNVNVEDTFEWITEEINVEKRDITHDGVADYIVTSMTYDPAYMDENATQADKIKQQVMYDMVCVRVYEGSSTSDTYSEEQLLWSQEYSSVHVGNGQISVVRMDDKDYILTSNLWAGQGFATWEFEVFSLNETGEKEVIDKQSAEFELQEDIFADEESYADFNHTLEEYITDGILIVACDIDFEQQLIRTQESQYIPRDYYSNALVKFDNVEDEQEQYIENTEKSVAEATMVDTSKVSSIVVTNGNTGEKITLTSESIAYKDLLKLYWQLDFTAEYEENTRVGYQYTMKLLDADGNKLQSVTPYKDGLIVDDIFYKYDNTGDAAEASIRLMDYLEYIFFPQHQSAMAPPITMVPVNLLENVTMTMETFNSCEGDIEIANQRGSEIATGEWYSIQRYEDGEWHRLDELIDAVWKDVEYRIPNGETAVLPTNWKTWYGELSSGKYRIVKEVYLYLENRIDTNYLATEFEIN